jgi:hypothetical protein
MVSSEQDFFSIAYVATWPRFGTLVSGKLYRQPTLARHIEGIASGSSVSMNSDWLTPSANEDAAGTTSGRMQRMLSHQARELYEADLIGPPRTASGPPAPDSGSTGGSRQESWQEKGVIVSTDWPTPMGAERQQEPLLNGRGEMNLPAIAIAAAGKTGGKLNPSWVETLMAFPIGWTQLPTKFAKPRKETP